MKFLLACLYKDDGAGRSELSKVEISGNILTFQDNLWLSVHLPFQIFLCYLFIYSFDSLYWQDFQDIIVSKFETSWVLNLSREKNSLEKTVWLDISGCVFKPKICLSCQKMHFFVFTPEYFRFLCSVQFKYSTSIH